jgi:putative ABC transport system permease protein
MNPGKNSPPSWILRFLQFVCPQELLEEIEGDLIQRYNRDVDLVGEPQAKRKIFFNVFRYVRPEIIFRNRVSFNAAQFLMFKNYYTTTWRHIRKHKINAVSRLGGLTLALFSFLIIALYISFQLSFDRYNQNYQNIYRVNTERKENGIQEQYGIAPLALGPMIQEKFPEIAAFTRIRGVNGSHLRYKDKVISSSVFPADSSLFDVFTFIFIQGNHDALKKTHSIVITKSLALNAFGAEDPMHKLITLGKDLYEVTAVIEDIRPDCHFAVEAFIPIEEAPELSASSIISPTEFVDKSCMLYLRFRNDAKPELFVTKLESMLDEHVGKKERADTGFRIFLQPLKNIYLDSSYKYEYTKKGSTMYLYIFFVLGVFLLIVACINYINLSVADFTNRSREIGIRKVMGARRSQIVFQVAFETLFYCTNALIISLGFVYLLFPKVLGLLDPNLRFEMLLQSRAIWIFGIASLILVICSIGLPAYWLMTSSASSDLKSGNGSNRPASLSSILLVAQFMISIICICATLVVYRQLEYIHHKDLGIDRKDLIILTMPEDFSVESMKFFKQQLKSISGVDNVSNSSFRMGGGYWKDWYEVDIHGEMKSYELYEVFSDDDLLHTLGMKLLDGRFLDASISTDSGAAFVINETAAQQLGLKNPVGTKILTHPEENKRWEGKIVGLVADININTLHQKVEPLVMRLPWQNGYPEYFIYVRLDGSAKETVAMIEKKYSEILPGYPIDLAYVDDFYNNRYQSENKAFASLQFGTVIVVLVSSLGIFSLAVYFSSRRMKEFGIRKVFGAGVHQITFMHIGHFLRLAVIANVIALPVSYTFMHEWLAGFAYRVEIDSKLFILVMCISFFLVIISAGYAAIRSGRMNPIDVIRNL